jgi:hypothetical protein
VAKKAKGTCALTGERGPFVKSHIIPRAFTPTYAPGKPMIQWMGAVERPQRRWDGLYDLNLVTRAGEDILERYDTWAVNEFRTHHMVWSSWGPSLVVPSPHDAFHPEMGVRVFDDIDPGLLRLFFASLLWRAAASRLSQLTHIVIPDRHLSLLVGALRTGRALGDEFYPVTLSQYSTMGHVHHANPRTMLKQLYDDDGNPTSQVPIFRFYFDGLIAHFHLPATDQPQVPLGISGVGNCSRLCVHTIPFEQSFQRLDIDATVFRSIKAWPKDAAKLAGNLRGGKPK